MRSPTVLFTFVLVLVLLSHRAASGEDPSTGENAGVKAAPDITQLMDDAERQRCGIGKLSEAELKNLNIWLANYTLRLATSLQQQSSSSREKKPAATAQPAPRKLDLSSLQGGTVVAEDGTYLGTVDTQYASDSIVNEYGSYGSPYSSPSIRNEYGTYGGRYSSLSPFNPYTSTPPRIFQDDAFVAYLTANEALSPRVDPRALVGWLKSR
jgi:hypothetical protein